MGEKQSAGRVRDGEGQGREMGFGWAGFKRWVKNRLFSAFWPVVRSRIFVKLRALVSKSLVPVSICGAGTGAGVGAAWALSFPLGYGALLGLAATLGTFGIVKLYQRLFPPQQTSRFIGIFRTQRETPSGRRVITETRVRGKSRSVLRR